MSLVDLVDDEKMSRQQLLEQKDGPALQCLRENRVVGVGAGLTGDVPRLDTHTRNFNMLLWGKWPLEATQGSHLVPGQTLHIHQDPHQFWDGQSRVGVVQLDRHLLATREEEPVGRAETRWLKVKPDPHFVRKRFKRGSDGISAAQLGGLEPANDVLQRCSHHEVFLLQPQLLPLEELQVNKDGTDSTQLSTLTTKVSPTSSVGQEVGLSHVVVGVENPGDVLRQVSVQNSFDVIANVD